MKSLFPALRRSLRERRRNRRGSRIEHTNRVRQSKARAHLARRRGGEAPKSRPRISQSGRSGRAGRPIQPLSGWALAAAFGTSLAIGALAGTPLIRAAIGAESSPSLVAISVLGNERLSAEEVADATAVLRGQALESLNADEVVTNLESHPWIRSAEAVSLPTGRLVVRIQERQPLAALLDAGEAGWRWVDAAGVPFAPTADVEAEAMPKLFSKRAFATGETSALLAEAVKLALEVPRRGLPSPARLELPDSGDTASSGNEVNDSKGWVLRTRQGSHSLEAVLGRGAELPARLDRLAWLLASDLDETRAAAVVDLRFEDQAVLQAPEIGSASSGGG